MPGPPSRSPIVDMSSRRVKWCLKGEGQSFLIIMKFNALILAKGKRPVSRKDCMKRSAARLWEWATGDSGAAFCGKVANRGLVYPVLEKPPKKLHVILYFLT